MVRRFVKHIDYDDNNERIWSISDTHKHHLILTELECSEDRLDEIIEWLNELYELTDVDNREKLVSYIKEGDSKGERKIAELLVKSYITPSRVVMDTKYTILFFEVTKWKTVNFPTLQYILGLNGDEWEVGWTDTKIGQVAHFYIDNKLVVNRKFQSKY